MGATLRIELVTASVNELVNLGQFKKQILDSGYSVSITVLDEGDDRLRKRNRIRLDGLDYEFFGPAERNKSFRDWFSAASNRYSSVIPERCHAETSFGFLVALKHGADIVVELDDDVFPVPGVDLLGSHLRNLSLSEGHEVNTAGKWYNSMNTLDLVPPERLFPRGHPYERWTRSGKYSWGDCRTKCVLNMGLWLGHPDLDALTIVDRGGLDGLCGVESRRNRKVKVVPALGTYFCICSMNASFEKKVVPAFYQLYMNYGGVDRFDDIWSGVMLKKIADHIGDRVSLGEPVAYHNKRPRSVWRDLKAEIDGVIINETLWKIIDGIELNSKDYYGCYSELAAGIEKRIEEFSDKSHRDFVKLQAGKMKTWLFIMDAFV